MAISCFEALLIIFSGDSIILFDFEIDDTIDKLGVSIVDQNLEDWLTV